jgi:DNA-binding MarR family transcriptional regulator
MSGEKSPTGKKRSEDHRLDSAVDRLVEEWAGVVPSLDRDVRAIAARIARIDDRLRARIATVLKRAGLSDSEFRLLAGVLRSGPPYQRAPSDLAPRYVPVTSGGLTGVANRLEKRGLITRVLHPTDQRSVLIELTATGKALALATMEEFAAVEETLMGDVSKADRAKVNAFLKKVLHSIEAKLDL